MLDVVDDQEVNLTLRRFQFESKLFLKSGEFLSLASPYFTSAAATLMRNGVLLVIPSTTDENR